jgi:hypothetical protein
MKKKKPLPKIDPNEWDFSRCPENELNFCCVYEYTRTAALDGFDEILLPSVLRMRSDFEKRGLASFDNLAKPVVATLGTAGLDIRNPGPGIFRLVFPFLEWPKKPWLSIAPEERVRRLKILFPDLYEAKT